MHYLCPGGCRTVSTKPGRCDVCKRKQQAKEDRARGTAYERGYNHEYYTNRAALLASNDLCWLCQTRGADTADHIVPLSRGGTNRMDNLAPAHKRCNSKRQNKVI
ncbi:HNH endonuclease [Amycolatopsis sp. NPDC003731]